MPGYLDGCICALSWGWRVGIAAVHKGSILVGEGLILEALE